MQRFPFEAVLVCKWGWRLFHLCYIWAFSRMSPLTFYLTLHSEWSQSTTFVSSSAGKVTEDNKSTSWNVMSGFWQVAPIKVKSLSLTVAYLASVREGHNSRVIYIHRLDIFLWSVSFPDSHRKRIADWCHKFQRSWKIQWKRKRKLSGRRERWASEEAMLLFSPQVDDKPVS